MTTFRIFLLMQVYSDQSKTINLINQAYKTIF
uniref:Uncharacterized protein n=1 Tax=Anguilla anguilla TaxID=7936 RepID=A0A0E9XPR6_ANGAN